MKSILLVDDDIDEYMIFLDALSMLPIGLSCDHQVDPEIALIRMCNKGYDFIFLDLNMPKINGLECAKRIRMMNEYKNVPIVLYSTSITPNSLAAAMDVGVTVFMTKSFSLEELAERLNEFFSTHYVL